MQGCLSLEQKTLQPFKKIAEENGFHVYEKQGLDNRIFLEGKSNFQFGDLRVNTPTHHVVIEAESAGGVTNLVKYWYCLSENAPPTHISLPIILIHVFQQTSKNDYDSHLKLWDFLWEKMQKEIDSNRIQAYKFPYHIQNPSEFKRAIDKFEMSLTSF